MVERFVFLKDVLVDPKWNFKHKPKAHVVVNNCEDAAQARKIALSQELKSIVMNVNDRLYAFHFRGDEDLDSRTIEKYFKKILKIKPKKFRFAKSEELQSLNVFSPKEGKMYQVQKGTVTPLNQNIWKLYTFVSPSLFSHKNEVVYTNDGTLDGQISFNPQLLKLLPQKNSKERQGFEFAKAWVAS